MNKFDKRKRRGKKTKAVQRTLGCQRLVVYKSNAHIYAQIVEDHNKGTEIIAAFSTLNKEDATLFQGTKVSQAASVGEKLAQIALNKGITKVAFDRNGNRYHGRVKALADGARKAGLEF